MAGSGRLVEALDALDAAERQFRAGGDEAAAARCDAGRSNVLENLGRHDEAIAAAGRWLRWLEQSPLAPERVSLIAQAHANIGVLLESSGDYTAALQAHDAAIARCADDASLAAVMQINRANALNLLGRSPEAFRALAAAAEVLDEFGGDDEDRAIVAINAAESLCRMGHPDRGLAWFARAAALVEPGGAEAATLLVETADALAALGAAEEAANRYRESLDVLAATPRAWLETRAWAGLGAASAVLGRAPEAAAAFERAAAGHLLAGNVPGWAVTEAEAIAALDANAPGRSARIEQVAGALADQAEEGWPVQATLVHLRMASLTSDERAAEAHLRRACDLAADTGVPHLRASAGIRLGTFLLDRRRVVEAATALAAALLVAERVRRRLHADELLRTFPATIVDGYDALVAAHLAQGRPNRALAAADGGRSRALTQGATVATGSGRDEVDDELSGIYDRLLALTGRDDAALRRELDGRARTLEAQRNRLELRAEHPVRRSGPDLGAAGDDLGEIGDDETQVVFQVRAGSVGSFVRTPGGVVFHGDLATTAEVGDELKAFRSAGRRVLLLAATGVDPALHLAAADARLRRLGALLLDPLGGAVGAARLVVVPHGLLHGVPFHALRIDGGRTPVLDRSTVTITPSLMVRHTRPVAPGHGRAVIVGAVTASLPGVAEELDRLAALAPDATVLRAGAATVASVTAAMDGAAYVHLADHGIFRPHAPLQSGIRLADGWLTARDVARVDLRGATVVLSACDTGRSVVAAGDELLGLQRGFLLAGARHVVMSLWPTVDTAAATMMTTLHEGLRAGLDVSAALRAAQLGARSETPHPWWWAPFFATGA